MNKTIAHLVIWASIAYYAFVPLAITARADSPFLTPQPSANASGASTLAINETIPVATSTVLSMMRVTAYASVPEETSDHPFIMADGHHVYDGAAASNILPFGSKIEIPALFGDKIFTIEDRTSPRYRETIDLWMPSVKAAIHFGMSHADIVVISEPTATTTLAVNN